VPKYAMVSFASSKMRWALKRIEHQGLDMKVFDHVWAWTPKDLDKDFRRTFNSVLNHNTPGYGYWAWKPQVILQAMDLLDDGDVLLYIDAGCHLNPAGRHRMPHYFHLTEQSVSGLLATQMTLPEKQWTKADLAEHLGVLDDPAIMDTGQFTGGLVFYRVSKEAKDFVREWLQVFETDLHLVDDSPSRLPNSPIFRAHRRDQSVFSILAKKHQIETFSENDIWVPDNEWWRLEDYPMHVRRDRLSPRQKFIKRLKKPGGARRELGRFYDRIVGWLRSHPSQG
jgi:hypothetical protein